MLSNVVKDQISHFHLFLRDPVGKEVRYNVLNVIRSQGRGVSSDRLSFSVKNSLSFINKLQCFFTKITVYLRTLSLPLGKNKLFLLAFLFLQAVVVIHVRIQSDDQ